MRGRRERGEGRGGEWEERKETAHPHYCLCVCTPLDSQPMNTLSHQPMNTLTRQPVPSLTLDMWTLQSPARPASSCTAGRTWSLQEHPSSWSTPGQPAPSLHPAWSMQENTGVYWGMYVMYKSIPSYTTSHLGCYEVGRYNLHPLLLKVETTLRSHKVSRQWSAHDSCKRSHMTIT